MAVDEISSGHPALCHPIVRRILVVLAALGGPSFPGTLGPRMVNLPGALPFGIGSEGGAA
jgi:hypothetical protein